MNRPRVRLDWNALCDEDPLEKLAKDCSSGVVTFLADAPVAVKDTSLPRTLCLSVLLKPDTETTPDVSIASRVLLEPEAFLEPEAKTIALSRLKTELDDAGLNRLKTESEELKVIIANECDEFKNALLAERDELKNALLADTESIRADLKGIEDRISTAVVESITDIAHTSGEHGDEEVCMDYVEDCIEDCGAEVAKAITCETS